ncbi:MAG: type secretion system family protein [Marmoricola sp.]|jgi:tight adherence protein C|nr:type secretion system family protein [Marmoricola sp.]
MSAVTIIMLIGVGGVFAGIFLSLTAIGVFTNETSGVSKSLAVVEAFSTAPRAMQDELDPGFHDRVLAPFLDRLVGLGRRLTPADYTDRILAKLNVAGNPPGWTVDRVLSLKVFGMGAGVAGGALFGLVLGKPFGFVAACAVLGTVTGYFGPNLYLYQKGYDRTAKIGRALPDALDLLSISVEAGLAFDGALSQVARNTDGPLADEFARVLQEMQIGLGRANALRALGERSNLPDLRSFCSAMVQADSFGIPIGQVLRVQSAEIRVKRRQSAEEAAQKIPVKIMIPLVLFILPALFVAVLGPAIIKLVGAFSSGGTLG